MPQTQEAFRIITNSFEGPFDLLLFFIERDELDIYDIPISKITDDFLAYLHTSKILDLDIASEFILVAAKLMRIKAKLLLPRKEKNELGEEIDPREELITRLLEYKQFKESLEEFESLENERLTRFNRANKAADIKSIAQKALVDIELENLSLTTLFNTFRRLMLDVQKRESKVIHQIVRYPFTIKSQRKYILRFFAKKPKVDFDDIFSHISNRMEAIVTYLAILEMLTQQRINIVLGIGKNSFWLTNTKNKTNNEEE